MIVIVTGTDTGVGKTVACAALAVRAGPGSIVVKPTQTGADTYGADIDVVHRLAACDVAEFTRLDDPLAPDTAARRHTIRLPPIEAHAERVRTLATTYDTVIIEGAGGLLVPLDNDGATLAELATTLAAEHDVLIHIVTRLGLGTVNHTALTVAALHARALQPTGLIIGAVPGTVDLAEHYNLTELPRVTGIPIVGAVPEGAGTLSADEFRAAAATWLPHAPHGAGGGTFI